MAERLTKKINKTIQDKYSLGSYLYYDFAEIDDTNQLLNKLGELEDIMEKYGIGIQNLDYILEDYSKNQCRDFAICEEMDDLKKDRDTWKKACELACDILMPKSEIKTIQLNDDNQIINSKEAIDYFYQQAKQFAGK